MKKVVLCLALLLCFSGLAQNDETMKNFDPNFVHVVYFWLNNPDNQDDRAQFEAALQKLLNKSKYTKTNYVGTPPKAIRDVVDDSFSYNLLVTFESAEAQESYQTEDVHLEFIEEAKHLWKKVVVYDAIESSFKM